MSPETFVAVGVQWVGRVWQPFIARAVRANHVFVPFWFRAKLAVKRITHDLCHETDRPTGVQPVAFDAVYEVAERIAESLPNPSGQDANVIAGRPGTLVFKGRDYRFKGPDRPCD